MKCLGTVLCVVGLFGSLSAQRVALDARHGTGGAFDLAAGADFAELRATLGGLGFEVVARPFFGPSDLAGMDAVFLLQTYLSRYTDGEIAALAAFAAGGGGVLVLADGGQDADSINFNMNALVAPYGVVFAGGATSPNGLLVQPLAANRLTQGVPSFGVDFHRRLTQIAAPALDVTLLGGEQDALAVAENYLGGGDVVILSDSTAFTTGLFADFDLRHAGNRRLLANIAVSTTSGRDELVVMPFDPGLAGQTNVVRAYDAAPGQRVFFVGGFAPGTVSLGCGATLGIQSPVLLGSALADGSGVASASLAVPAGLAGTTALVQAVQLGSCGVSNLLRARF